MEMSPVQGRRRHRRRGYLPIALLALLLSAVVMVGGASAGIPASTPAGIRRAPQTSRIRGNLPILTQRYRNGPLFNAQPRAASLNTG